MLNEHEQRLDAVLQEIAKSLDISPTDYKRAVESYGAVGQWLEDGYQDGAYPGSTNKPKIYPQGSIRLGTVVKPLRGCKDAAYDVDLVCELQDRTVTLAYEFQGSTVNGKPEEAQRIKNQVGERLKANETYDKKIKNEGKRCWTIEYAKSEGVGFHMDILPCVPDTATGIKISQADPTNPNTHPTLTQSTIGITDQRDSRNPKFKWFSSNPRGYAKWFFGRNNIFSQVVYRQKQLLLETAKDVSGQRLYESIAQVPDELVRTPLQRAVQILKRHRDVRFKDKPDTRPISMIITTLAAHLYQGEPDLFSALMNIISKLGLFGVLVEDRQARLDESVAHLGLIQRREDGTWYIPNPVNPAENFADCWHENNHAKARAFFEWVGWLKQDLERALRGRRPEELRDLLGIGFGLDVVKEAVSKIFPATVAVTTPREQSVPHVRIESPSKPWSM